MSELDLSKLRVHRDTGARTPLSARKRFGGRKLWGIAAVIVVAVWLALPKAVVVQATQVVSAWPSQQYVLLNATGYVVPKRKAAAASKGTGRVKWLGVSEGDSVKEGQVIARLEDMDVEATYQAASANTSGAQASLLSAQSQVDDAKRNLDRTQLLFDRRLIGLVNLQDAKSSYARSTAARASAAAAVEAAKANQRNAQTAVEYTLIRAPFDGVVISRFANVGDIVTPLSSAADAKGSVVVIADMSTLEVDAEVSESSLSQIKTGQPCEIVLDAFPDRRFRGEVSLVVPRVNRASATVTTKVRFLDPDPSILPDMGARVAFLSQAVDSANQKPVLAVNPEAIVERDGKAYVYRIGADGRAVEVPVTAGAVLGGVREISGDIKLGDNLALAAPGKLRANTRIKLGDAR